MRRRRSCNQPPPPPPLPSPHPPIAFITNLKRKSLPARRNPFYWHPTFRTWYSKINNPLTALGLTTGLVDAAILARFLAPLFTTPSGHSVSSSSSFTSSTTNAASWAQKLDKYGSMRREDFVTRVQKRAIEGKLRIHSANKQIVTERDDFYNMLNKNPGFGMFVATSMLETLPDNLEPGPLWVNFCSVDTCTMKN